MNLWSIKVKVLVRNTETEIPVRHLFREHRSCKRDPRGEHMKAQSTWLRWKKHPKFAQGVYLGYVLAIIALNLLVVTSFAVYVFLFRS